jgi:hypothetical protein
MIPQAGNKTVRVQMLDPDTASPTGVGYRTIAQLYESEVQAYVNSLLLPQFVNVVEKQKASGESFLDTSLALTSPENGFRIIPNWEDEQALLQKQEAKHGATQ